MPNINLDDAYILGETGAQVDKVTGLFTKDEDTTSGEKAFAQLNIGTAGSNRNLLDNPWWGSGEAVNQRNTQSKPSNGSYTIDRWILTSGADANQWAIGANGITFTIASSSIWYTQRTPNPSAWSGKTLTASVLLSDGTIKSGSAAFTYGTAATFYNDSAINLSMNAQGQFVLAIRSTQTIRAVKLELGSVSTLANDAPPEPSIASIPCYENFLRLKGAYAPVGYAIGVSTTLALVVIPTPVPMRALPRASLSGTLYFNAGTPFAVTGLNSTGTTFCVNQITQQVNGSFEVGKVYLAQFRDANSYLDLSADL